MSFRRVLARNETETTELEIGSQIPVTGVTVPPSTHGYKLFCLQAQICLDMHLSTRQSLAKKHYN